MAAPFVAADPAAAAAAAANAALLHLGNHQEELGISVPTEAELAALHGRLQHLGARFRPEWREFVKVRRAMGRGALHTVCAFGKGSNPYRWLGALRGFDDVGVLNNQQVRGLADVLDSAIMGRSEEDVGIPKSEAFRLFFEAMEKAVKDAEVGAGLYRARVVIACTLDGKIDFKMGMRLAKIEDKVNEKVQALVQSAVDKLEKRFQSQNFQKREREETVITLGNPAKKPKSMTCLAWVKNKGKCAKKDAGMCDHDHFGTLQKIAFLNERYECGLSKQECMELAS